MMQLQTATDILDAYQHPRTVQEYKTAFRWHIAKKGLSEQPQPGVLKAGIDCGRWITNCECGGGIALHPDWNYGACFSCGRSWDAVEFPTPAFLARLEELFKQRPASRIRKDPKRFWSWWPELETLEDVQAENLLRGWVPTQPRSEGDR